MEVTIAKRSVSLFTLIGIIGLLGAVTGFMGTFFLPVATGAFKAPLSIYIHGAFAFAWIIIFLTQTLLIRSLKFRTHILLGTFGIFVAIGTAATMIPAGIFATNKELAKGMGDFSYAQITGTLTSSLLFLTLVMLAVLNRKRPDVHKRFMLLATILVLWPAWFRFRHFFPGVPRPDIWFGLVLSDSLILFSWIYEKKVRGRIHPVLLYGGLALIIENTLEIILFESSLWQYLGKAIYTAGTNAGIT